MTCQDLTEKIKEVAQLNSIVEMAISSGTGAAQALEAQKDIEQMIFDVLEESNIKISVEAANRLFGDRFIGPDTAEELIGENTLRNFLASSREKDKGPKFTIAELIKAKKEGAYLIFRDQRDRVDKPIDLIILQSFLDKLKEKTGVRLEIKNGVFLTGDGPMAHGWALVYDFGAGQDYLEQWLTLENIIKRNNIHSSQIDESLSYYQKAREKMNRINSTDKVDYLHALNQDNLNNILRPSAVEFIYDLMMKIMKGQEIKTGVFWTNSDGLNSKLAVNVSQDGDKVTATFEGKDITSLGGHFIVNRLEIFEKFDEVVE